MLVDKQRELMRDLLPFSAHQHGGDDVTWKPPIETGSKLEQVNIAETAGADLGGR